MKKTLLASVVVLIAFAFMICCKSESDPSKALVGKWKRTNVDTVNLVVEFTADKNWNYYKNDQLLEKGKFEIANDKFIMKHAVEEHNHKEGEKHDHPKDHEYKFTFNADKTELSIISDTKTTVYKKIQ